MASRGDRLRGLAGLARYRRRVLRPVAQAPSPKGSAMTRYVTVRLTIAQAKSASNACDLIANSLHADGVNKREMQLYERTGAAIDEALRKTNKEDG
jgi:hypothetical protein